MLMDPIQPGGLSAMDHMAPTGNHGGHTNGLHHHHGGHVEHVDEMEDREVLFLNAFAMGSSLPHYLDSKIFFTCNVS